MARRISQDEKAKGGPEFGEADEGMLGAGSLSATLNYSEGSRGLNCGRRHSISDASHCPSGEFWD